MNVARFAALFAVWLALMVGGAEALAQTGGAWPSKPVRFIVPLPPGGTADAAARIMAEKLSVMWGQAVTVDNRAGGNGIIGTEALARSAPDGYTIGMGYITTQATNQFLYARLPYDPDKDFTPIAWITNSPLFLVVHPSVPANTLQELITYARSNPGKLSFATVGNGSSMHLAAEMLMQRTGIQMVHIPYKGMGQAAQDLVSGRVQVAIDISMMAQAKTGKLKALGVASTRRFPGEPNVPSFAEQGLADFELLTWLTLHAPSGLPAELQMRINADVNKVLAMPDAREKMTAMSMSVTGGTPAQLAAHLASERRKFAAIISAAGLKPE